jgi:hypothetical protein
MKTIALAFALILAPTVLVGSIQPPVPKVEAWPRYEVTGKVLRNETLILFGAGPKQMWIETIDGTYHYLAFGCEKDYEQAERLTGQLVEVEGYVVSRGYEHWLVPVVMRERVKAKEKEAQSDPDR